MSNQFAARPGARDEWRAGWPLVLASAAGMSLAPMMFYTMGLFVAPLEAEFGWGRSTIMVAFGVNSAIAVVFAPFIGSLIDRYGPRVLAVPGVIAFCGSFALLSTVTDSPLHWWAQWALIGLSALLITPTLWTYAVMSRFDEARGLALACALSGTALSGIVAPVLANFLIQNFGWRWAYVGIGATYFAIALPLMFFFFFSAFELSRTRQPDVRSVDAPARPPLPGLTVRQAIRGSTFWKIAIATFLILLPIGATVVHLVPALTQAGLGRSGAVLAASCSGFAAVGGRLLAGFLLDRFNAKLLAGTAFALPVVTSLGLFFFQGDFAMAIGIALLLGITTGAELEMSSFLASKHFGLRNFGTLFGLISGLIALAGGLGPFLGGLAFDLYGSYSAAWIGAGMLALTASAPSPL